MFNYTLPTEKIAQHHASLTGVRSDSRLLVATQLNGRLEIQDSVVGELADYLRSGDLLILNNTAVRPSRFLFELDPGREGELFLLGRSVEGGSFFEALARPMGQIEKRSSLKISHSLIVTPHGRTADGSKLLVQLETIDGSDVEVRIRAEGLMPIPPYIRGGRADAEDRKLYQTVYAKEEGSFAAPTAGLHFTPELLLKMSERGVAIKYLTLHVGAASFRQAQQQDQNLSFMEPESFLIPTDTDQAIQEAKTQGGKIVAVGTTTVRALESFALNGEERDRFLTISSDGWHSSRLLIKPGFNFRVVDRMFTNFHQPGSTHLLLVSAFAGEGEIERIYSHALNGEYRFLSYGDAMLLDPAS